MTTQPGELDDTLDLDREDGQEDEGQSQVEYLRLTREQYDADLKRVADEAFARAQRRMEGELNSQKDRRFNDLEREIKTLKESQTAREREREFEAATINMDDDQRRALRILWERTNTTTTPEPEPPPAQRVSESPDETENRRVVEQFVSSWGITAKWGDGSPVWEGLSGITDAPQFASKLQQNVRAEIEKKALAEATRGRNGNARAETGNPNRSAPPAIAPGAGSSRLTNRDAIEEAFIMGRIDKAERERRIESLPRT